MESIPLELCTIQDAAADWDTVNLRARPTFQAFAKARRGRALGGATEGNEAANACYPPVAGASIVTSLTDMIAALIACHCLFKELAKVVIQRTKLGDGAIPPIN